MRNSGLVLGILVSFTLVACNFLDDWNDFELKIDEGAFDFGQPSFGPLPGLMAYPFKIDSATHLEHYGLKLWTSLDFSILDSAISGRVNVEYWNINDSNGSQNPKIIKMEYLPDSISDNEGQRYLVFPIEIQFLNPETEYEFCINLHLFKDEEKINEIGTCKTYQTAS